MNISSLQLKFKNVLDKGYGLLIEKIQSYVLNTIPLWKNQIALALGLVKQKDTLDLQKDVSDATGKLLKQNSKILQNNTMKMQKYLLQIQILDVFLVVMGICI